jgi:hypothetical protein
MLVLKVAGGGLVYILIYSKDSDVIWRRDVKYMERSKIRFKVECVPEVKNIDFLDAIFLFFDLYAWNKMHRVEDVQARL